MEKDNIIGAKISHSRDRKNSASPDHFSKKSKKLKKDRKRKHSSSSEKSEIDYFSTKSKHKKCKKRHKHEKEKKHKRDKHPEKNSIKKNKPEETLVGPELPNKLMDKSKMMAPMSREEWDKQQKITRRIYDEGTGRTRLIRGDGEVIEEIVSRERHREINRQATKGDGVYFESKMKTWMKK